MSINDTRSYAGEKKKISHIFGCGINRQYISMTRACATKTNKVGLGSTESGPNGF